MKINNQLYLAAIIISISSSSLDAGILDKLKKVTGDALESGWKVTTAPIEAVANTGKVLTGNAKPKDIFQPYKELGKVSGNTVGGATDLISNPQKKLFEEVRKFVSKAGGKPGEFVFDISTFNNQFYSQLGVSGGHGLANVLRGQNPLQVTAAPLAAAIRAARERHAVNAKPLPDDVKKALTAHFDAATLNRAKYAVGTVEITLPNFIGKGNKFMGNDYAVVVDDIIVFSSDPPSYDKAAFWWAHEVTHIDQYRRVGVESFSFKYLRDLGSSIEKEADAKAQTITGNTKFVGAAFLAPSVKAQRELGIRRHSHGSHQHKHLQNPVEYFIAQCFFPNDRFPVNYLITNTRKIIAVDPMTGGWIHIGHATPPLAPGVAWTYQTPRLRYAVFPSGQIVTDAPVYNTYGQVIGSRPIQIGHVNRF